MTVAAAANTTSDGVSINHELRLLKVALLYADRVRLYSPAVNIISKYVRMAVLPRDNLIREYVGSEADSKVTETFALLVELRSKENRTSHESSVLASAEKRLDEIHQDILRNLSAWADETKLTEINRPVQEGIIEIVQLDLSDTRKGIVQFITEVVDVIASGNSYALVDDLTGAIVNEVIHQHTLPPLTEPLQSGMKQPAILAELFSELPLFESARLDEILDIRRELEQERIRFCATIIDYASKIQSLPWDDTFEAELDLLFRGQVKPAIADIVDSIKSNMPLAQFAKNVYTNPATIAGALGLVAGPASQIPGLIGLTAGVGSAMAKTYFETRSRQKQLKSNGLYFYYAAGELLANKTKKSSQNSRRWR